MGEDEIGEFRKYETSNCNTSNYIDTYNNRVCNPMWASVNTTEAFAGVSNRLWPTYAWEEVGRAEN